MNNRFKDYLKRKRPKAEVQSENEKNILFKEDKLNFIFTSFADNPYYFRIILPKIYIVPQDKDAKFKLYEQMDTMNKSYMVAKSIVVDDELWISAETFKFTDDKIDELFENLIQVLQVVYNEYVKIFSNDKTSNDETNEKEDS